MLTQMLTVKESYDTVNERWWRSSVKIRINNKTLAFTTHSSSNEVREQIS